MTDDRAAKAAMIRDFVRQCFDIFPRYGVAPDALLSITRGFAVVLGDHAPEDITAGFGAWLRKSWPEGISPRMPVPSEIADLATAAMRRRNDSARPRRRARPAIAPPPRRDLAALGWAGMSELERGDLALTLAGLPGPARRTMEGIYGMAQADWAELLVAEQATGVDRPRGQQ